MHLLFLLLHSLAWQPLAHTLWLRSIPILLLENKSANSFSSLQPLSLFSTLPTSNYWSMALPCPGFHLPLCLFLFYALSTFLFFFQSSHLSWYSSVLPQVLCWSMFQTCFISPLCLHYKLPRCLILRLKMFIPTSVPVYSKLHTHGYLHIHLIFTALKIIGIQQQY